MTIVIAIIIGILLLGLLVFVHEAGHFFTAKFFKVKVEEFGFGFPPRIFGRKFGETIYSINAIPAGGFVRLFGEEGDKTDNPRSFSSKGPWVRSGIIVAGVVVNLVAAFVLFTALLSSSGFRSDIPINIPTTGDSIELSFPFGKQTDGVLISFVSPGSPAQASGLQNLDRVESANGQTFTTIAQFQEFVLENRGKKVNLQVYNLLDRNSRSITATPRVDPPEDEGALGVVLDEVTTVRYETLIEKVFVGPAHSVNMLYYQGKAIGTLFSSAFEKGTIEPVAETVRGPVGIAALLGTFIGITGTRGAWLLVETMALISLILAVVNVLPIPAVDGGRLFFTVFEGVTGKKVKPSIERAIHTFGFVVLIV
ncbi:site-2 protease family protein, partial [Patescibacteria group bacterium]|nr:site-2 protease family protein [Patescibacteria group bacterium]